MSPETREALGPLGESSPTGAARPTILWRPLAARRLQPGERLGPYEIGPEIGGGGQGIVYRAQQLEPVRREVALKVLHLRAADPEAAGFFRLECQALARLNHDAIARFFDAGTTPQGAPYYVLEYVEGNDLSTYCDARGLQLDRRLELFVKVCEGVHHAHLRGVIHRDLKPGNILVSTPEGGAPQPKVIDFGLAKAVGWDLEGRAAAGPAGELLGTPLYMSPEQAEGTEADARTDVYSLGAVLYELLAGSGPIDFSGVAPGDRREIRCRIAEVGPRPLVTALAASAGGAAEVAARRGLDRRALEKRLQGDLAAIACKALRRRPDERYTTARELADDIRRYQEQRPVAAVLDRREELARTGPRLWRLRHGGAAGLYRLRKLAWRERRGLAALGVLLLVAWFLVAAGRYRSWQRFSQSVAQGRAAVAARDFARAAPALAFLRKEYPGHGETDALGRLLVSALEKRATELWGEYRRRRQETAGSLEEWRQERDRDPTWRPAWRRQEELRHWREFQERKATLGEIYNDALALLSRALEIGRPEWEETARARDLRGRIYLELYRSTRRAGDPLLDLPAFFRRTLEKEGSPGVTRALSASGTLRLSTVPPGAEVYCFRYEEIPGAARLVPLPFHPARGVTGRPAVRVERVWEPSASPFQEGDLLVKVAGRAVEIPEDVARAIEDARPGPGREVAVDLVRGDRTLTAGWVPFPERAPEALRSPRARFEDEARQAVVSFFHQFGFVLAGYPLECGPENLLGRTEGDGPLVAELPPGSYLLLLRREDRAVARLPFAVPREEGRGGVVGIRAEPVWLPRRDEVPPGFLYVPAGELGTGGDPEAFGAEPWAVREVGNFFMSRLEVSTRDWLEFANDEEVNRWIDDSGRLDLGGAEWTRELGRGRVWVIPGSGDFLFWRRDPQSRRWEVDWSLAPSLFPGYAEAEILEWPVFSVPQLAACAYALWRSEQGRRQGEPWRYRLPSDREWERAARGADRRHFVWGDYLVWRNCATQHGSPSRRGSRGPEVRGVHPFDESPLGIRDLEGNVMEHTTGRPLFPRVANTSYRGGGFFTLDDLYFRLASRNTFPPGDRKWDCGVRLVAELAGRAGTGR